MQSAVGVYFRRQDYAPFWIRFLVDLIDFVVFGIICAAILVTADVVLPTSSLVNFTLLAWLATAFAYFVILKRSRFRTLGYRLGRVRIVGLDGLPPSYLSLSFRLMFALLGPWNWLVDLVWFSGDAHRQALRDKFAATYVIKQDSQPAGQGRLSFRYYEIMLYHCLFREIEVEPTASAQRSVPR